MIAKRKSAAADERHRTNVLLEDLRSQQRALFELVVSSRDELIRMFDTRFTAIETRLTLLEEAVRQNSRDIQKNSEDIRKNSEDIRKNSEDIRKNSADILQLQIDVRQLRRDFEHREDRARIDALEKRVEMLEKSARD